MERASLWMQVRRPWLGLASLLHYASLAILILTVSGCANSLFDSSAPRNQKGELVLLCAASTIPQATQWQSFEYGKLEDNKKHTVGYAKARVRGALSAAGLRVLKVTMAQDSLTYFTEAQEVYPDGGVSISLRSLWNKVIGDWVIYKRVLAFTFSDNQVKFANDRDVALDENGVLHSSSESCQPGGNYEETSMSDSKIRRSFRLSVSVYIFFERNEQFVIDKTFNVPIEEQLDRSGIRLWPF